MKVEAFEKQTSKFHNYDRFWHTKTVDSKVGAFVMELTVALNAEPTHGQIEAMQELVTRFESNKETIIQMMFQEYAQMSASDPEFENYFSTPANLTIEELTPYVQSRLLTVSSVTDDITDPYYPRVLILPFWNLDGFCVRFNDDKIERLRPRRGKDF